MPNLQRLLMWIVAGAGLLTAAAHALTVPLNRTGPGTVLATEPGAPEARCIAVRITDQPGTVDLGMVAPSMPPGLYRVSLPLRFLTRPNFDPALLKLVLHFRNENSDWLPFPVALSQLDASTGAWTVLTKEVLLEHGLTATNRLRVAWNFFDMENQLGKKTTAAFDALTNLVESENFEFKKGVDESTTHLLSEMDADAPRPVSKIDYPALLIGDPKIESVTTNYLVQKVWPEFVHVYPGGSNPVEVTVRNFTGRPATGKVRLEMQTGLDETSTVGVQPVTIPAAGTTTVIFPWSAGQRSFGYGAVATLFVDGHEAHTNAEYFSVGTPIWKTAIQGSGFLSWYGRENKFKPHVEANRRAYINVEEAFSWQPSSWTDLNPSGEDWWTGQGNFHNSRKGLLEWSGLSHSNGIKLITYSWASTSGKAGFDAGRRFPFLLARYANGIGSGVDLEALEMCDMTQSRKELWQFQSRIWEANAIDLGRLLSIDLHAREVIRSARTYGWDGIRFDYPPAWSAMGTGEVKQEFDQLGVNEVMKRLLPEYYATTNDSWSAQAITARNFRYFRYIFAKELGTNFAVSYNGGDPSLECEGGGQVMNESIRSSNDMATYLAAVLPHSLGARELGGYTCVFPAERCLSPLGPVYSAIFTFASGSHPYGDYGWANPMPGAYTQFMTRYGEYCWDLALAPVTAQQAGVRVDSSQPVLWENFIRQRGSNGMKQTVVHLITPPEWDGAKFARQAGAAWARNVIVRKRGAMEPVVWLLSAEPRMSATRLPTERSGDGYSVTVPVLRTWSLLVWSEQL